MYLILCLFLGNFISTFTFNVKQSLNDVHVIRKDNFRKEVLVRENDIEKNSYFGHDFQMFTNKIGEK